ncbi:chemotaxis regulatory protein ChePep [Helicobacter pylori]
MKMILFNQNPMIAKLLESVSNKLELSIENFNHYQELSAHLKKDPEWLLIADDECLEKLDQIDWLELKETISQNKNSVCMYKKGNESQPFLEGFEVKIKKPFLPTEMLKVLQKKLGSNASELETSQNLDPTQEVLETNWDELENLGDLEALAKEEPNNEEQLLPTLDAQEEKEEVKQEEKEEVKQEEKEEVKQEEKEEVKQEEKEEVKQEEKEEVKETLQEEKPKDDETQEGDETPKDEEVSKELETQEEVKEETQEEQVKEQEPLKEETQEIKEEKQEETQDSPSAQELEAMQELVKEIQENSNENKKETQESAEIPQDKEIQEVVTEKTQVQELEVPKEKVQESAEALQETQAQELEKEENSETPQDVEVPQSQEKETPQEETQEKETPQEETQEKETPQTQDEKPQEDHYESIEDIPEPVMAKAMGEELPFLNEAVAKTPNNENDTETPKESVTETSKNENDTETPQEKEESDKTSSPLELRLNLQDLLKNLNQESLKSLLENKTLSIKITLEDKKPNA